MPKRRTKPPGNVVETPGRSSPSDVLAPPPNPDLVRDFIASMPRAYRYVFSERGIADHARLAIERGRAVARIGRFHSRRDLGAGAICVIADDRPGLLAMISAALVSESLDVVHAEAYTRTIAGGGHEAVDVFWVRDMAAPDVEHLGDERLAALERTLIDLIEGRQSPAQFRRTARPAAQRYEANVRFVEGEDGQLSTLEVETVDRSGLLLALAHALFESKVQITRSAVHTEGERVRDLFVLLELDGSPIGPARRLDIQVAVMTAIDPALAG